MSIIPLLHLARELDHDYRTDWGHLLEDDFGFGVHAHDLFHPRRLLLPNTLGLGRRRYSPYERSHGHHNQMSRRASGGPNALLPAVGKDGFQVCMDVSQFKPNELTVKVVDNTVVVEGKHEEREDGHGMIQRHFVRKYTLPKGFDPNEVVSTVSSDGVLTLKAPPPPSKEQAKSERIVQIQQTGPAHLSVKAPAPEAGDGKAENGSGEKMETSK
uniref:Heat shock protein 27 n=2 Tax=Drosophila melanogaster TaxID=7227 RepID=HSP27_DROME|nr:heat shock protein 27, isoform B [Drosophila melanogaster]NP_524000.1 heat shock protein 27, isoform A [Drosophila melanogaster]P02518.2 RecName: Full=Heat shock protein 27 [Drosophila melanogaster]AAA28638.1 heat shock protein hsp27 [Drosophila melanogaster]AAF50285.1 heat shock protein 27, isoform A [Drosophila melanogaster]AAM49840.1 GM13686p [Drosophila melanogaster]AHN58026.1 heat shock protein 27, isoform B [Drosophila melanogaster]CAA27527.1 heat shock protein hsp 27 [Drosophila me|eukprot:NP_001287001.1 heat shock protein 27, isoform B [Drosophila melanogaster]